MITLDTSGIIALFNRRDKDHPYASESVQSDSGPLIVPAGILGEVTYMLEEWAGNLDLDAFLLSIDEGSLMLDCGEQDIPRIRQLVARYQNLPLGFADACVIACAERRGGRVLTFDERHFAIVAREGTITLMSGDP